MILQVIGWGLRLTSLLALKKTLLLTIAVIVTARIKIKIKIKQSRNRPVVAQRVPGGLGSHDIRHMKVVRLPASRTGRLYPQEMFLVLIFTRG